MRVRLKESRPYIEGEGTYPSWRLSGFRSVAHLIYDDGEYLKAACGTFWWMSDGMTSNPPKEGGKYCRACLKTKRAKEMPEEAAR